MIYVVNRNDNRILNRCDAWELNGDLRMEQWATDNGYMVLKAEITLMGDMVIWVE